MLKVCVPLRGRATVHQGDREIVLRPGQLGLYDIGRPYELRLEGSRDALSLMDTLALEAPILAGYDWGGRAVCVAAGLRPDRVGGIVALGGYSVQAIARSAEPARPLDESRDWYQYYFHGERGRAGLTTSVSWPASRQSTCPRSSWTRRRTRY